MAIINHKVKILNKEKTQYDTYHIETNVSQVYDFTKSKWLNEIIADLESRISNATSGIDVTELNKNLNLTMQDLDSAEALISAIQIELAKKYVKPTTGITLQDLESSIKTSLSKADKVTAIEADITKIKSDIVTLQNNYTTLSTSVNTRIEELKNQIVTSTYIHPDTHPASMIVQDANNRFITDSERLKWNNKADKTIATTNVNGLMTSTDKTKLDGIETGATNTTVINNLTSSSASSALSAYQGKVLYDALQTNGVDLLTHANRNDNPHKVTTEHTNYLSTSKLITDAINTYQKGITLFGLSSSEVITWRDAIDTSITGTFYGYVETIHAPYGFNSRGIQKVVFLNTSGTLLGTYERGAYGTTVWGNWNKIITNTDLVTTSTNGLMSSVDKSKLDGIATGANNYVHPTSHPASIIIQDANNRFITDLERASWNAKASSAPATTTVGGLMTSTDKIKLDGIATNANNYVHPTSHPASIITETTSKRFVTDTEKSTWNAKASTAIVSTTANGLMSTADKIKLDGIATNANNYIHPDTHPASMIIQDASNRFVTDGEKTSWNNKADSSIVTTSANGLMSSADKTKLNGIATGATNTVLVNNLTSTSTTSALSANQGKILKDLIDAGVNISVATTTTNGLMSSTDKAKLDGVEIGATRTVVTNTLTSTSSINALSAYQGKVLYEALQSSGMDLITHANQRNNPHGVTTEHTNYLSSPKLITDAINTYPKGITIFGLTGTEASTWKNEIDTSITGTIYGYVETTLAPSGSAGRGSQKVVFLNSSAVILGIYERGAYSTTTWGSWNKLPTGLEGVISTRTDTAPTSRFFRDTMTDVVLAITAIDNVVSSNLSNSLSLKKPIVLVQPGYVDNQILVTPYDSNTINSYKTAIGSGTSAGEGYATAIGVGAQAGARYSNAIGSFARALNQYEGQLGTTESRGGGAYNWIIPGNLSVNGYKAFEMPHPNPDKKYTHILRHSAVESPTEGDTLYRYTITATEDNQTVEIDLPDYFIHLNKDVDIWINPHKHFGRAYGEMVGEKLLINCEKAGEYKVLAIGTRNDDAVQDWYLKGVEREIGESWTGETYSFEVTEIEEFTEFGEEM